ncbi:dihydrofolate reductase [Pelagicoccus sp. NFK12]|uniref:Dihydrofolate reductase n=1 Tax=Pelagicoccus enzymogenes TaxID=2773457 RepID=A0A927F7K7_9BACT|nr:dihydrofolate reductase family protein [Pelagicoccus enzymogenes]MBD5778625.1 dihydrofolate reductase [Pelagicoccus enzymogenes]MDQ8197003.1 dihydrofolate reductase family protein [Pelagicoccus enzymogenes]
MLILIAAQSLDGFIARPDRAGTDFCSEADASFLRDTLKKFDSLIMGRKTFETLRERILNSDTKRYLRKIITRSPAAYAADTRPDLVEFTDQPPIETLSELAGRGRKKTALLGGGEIYTQYLEAGVVDELWITIEPLLFGGGTPLLGKANERPLKLLSHHRLSDETLLLKYKPL